MKWARTQKCRLESQAQKAPLLYSAIDLSTPIERFTTEPETPTELGLSNPKERHRLISNSKLMSGIKSLTLTGDVTADALVERSDPQSMKILLSMLNQSGHVGLESAPEAPAAVRDFIGEMERRPNWYDPQEIEHGLDLERRYVCTLGRVLVRSSLMGTYLNPYAAAPFMVEGEVTRERAMRRIAYVSSYFAATMLPGALNRDGIGFRLSAFARLFHAKVRTKCLSAGSTWDYSKFGVPIPLSDQIATGLFPIYMIAKKIVERGHDEFSADERAVFNAQRYRCILMGIPNEALPSNPIELVEIMLARTATLRVNPDIGYSQQLIRAAQEASLRQQDTLMDKAFERVERRFSNWVFANFIDRNGAQTSDLQIAPINRIDTMVALLFGAAFMGSAWLSKLLNLIPVLNRKLSQNRVSRLKKYIQSYSNFELSKS